MAVKKVISPRLGRFHMAYPDVVLDIVVDDSLSDIVAGRFDAGIRVGRRLEKDMNVVRLTADVKMIVAASPDYLARAESRHRLSTCGAMPASTGDFPAEMDYLAGSSRRRAGRLRSPWKGH